MFMKTLPLLLLSLAALLAGCAHEPASNDALAVNTAVLSQRTGAALSNGDAGRLTLAESRTFLRQSREQVRGMRAHAEECRMSPDEVNILDWLDGEYTALLRRPRPVNTATTRRLQNTLATWESLRPGLSYGVASADTTAMSDTSSGSIFDTDTTTDRYDRRKKDCDDHHRDHDHDHHDHDHDGHDKDHDHNDKDCGCDHNHH